MTTYYAFISYSHADSQFARWLQRGLESYRVPRSVVARGLPARLYPVFLDRSDMRASPDLEQNISAALADSNALIVICSPAAASSVYVDLEIRTFRALHPDRPILSLIVAGTPIAHVAEGCFPEALYVAGHAPVAADLRAFGDGRRMALLKLVAGLLGIELVLLANRDARRRLLRLRIFAAGTLVGIATLALLLFQAVRARQDADRQRNAAEALVEFMVGDLRKRLDPIGKLSILDAVSTRAYEYYRGQRRPLGPTSEARRARVLRLVGELKSQQGDLAGALANYQAAAASTERLLALAPDNPERIYNHAQSIFFIGAVAQQRHELDVAEQAFRHYAELAARLVQIDPKNVVWQAESGYAASNLGTVLLDRGQFRASEVELRRALVISIFVSRLSPNDFQLQFDLAQSYAWFADPLIRRGQFRAALAAREVEREIYQRLRGQAPDDKRLAAAMVDVEISRSAINRSLGNTSEALAAAELGLSQARTLYASDSRNQAWASLLTGAAVQRAWLLTETSGAVGPRLKTLNELVALIPSRARTGGSWSRSLAQLELVRSNLMLENGDSATALKVARRALHIITLDNSGITWNEQLVQSLIRLQVARCLISLGDKAEAAVELAHVDHDAAAHPADDYEFSRLGQIANRLSSG